MSRLPPNARLVRVVRGLTGGGLVPFDVLLSHPRFERARPLLERLATADLSAVPPAEAGWLADALAAAWAELGAVSLGPAIGIDGPTEIWVGREPRPVTWEVLVEGLDAWEAQWNDEVDGPIHERRLGPDPGVVRITARVIGREGDERRVLREGLTIAVRRIEVRVREDRRAVLLVDQDGTPGRGVRVRIGDRDTLTDGAGLVQVEGAVAGARIEVDGIHAGKLPD